MADFAPAFEEMIRNEGGYILHNVPGDRGGDTYAGVARRFHPHWAGWQFIDSDDLQNPALFDCVNTFYREHFWQRLRGDDIADQRIAETLFDFAVNAGLGTAAKLAQSVLGVTADGIIGPVTIGKLNDFPPNEFLYRYAMAKVARYAEIVNRDKSQSKFLLGWINRTLKGVA
ncbi:glycoside hydrolase family 108 protein [Litorivivens sp.]|uniref:glycoside hydrolase family 108 protein n=2 Tax=Litorivivens sp. TaxID=2020868 RepID=UPI003565CB19